jgi:hypothetical protein
MYNNAFTIEMREGYSRIVGPMAETNPRPHQMSSLLDGFAKFLPDMNITITGHDSPWVVLSGEARAAHIVAAKAKRRKRSFLIHAVICADIAWHFLIVSANARRVFESNGPI